MLLQLELKSVPKENDSYIYQIDFKGGKLKGIENSSELEAVVTATDSAQISEISNPKNSRNREMEMQL
jgi:glucan biosynthesis protein